MNSEHQIAKRKKEVILLFFQDIAKRKFNILKKIEKRNEFYTNHAKWEFTLPDLFAFIQQNLDDFNYSDYKEFRKILFSIPLNTELKKYNAIITIEKNMNNVDKTTYALFWKNQ